MLKWKSYAKNGGILKQGGMNDNNGSSIMYM